MKKIVFFGIVIVLLPLVTFIIVRGGIPGMFDTEQSTKQDQQFESGHIIVSVKRGFSQQEIDGALAQLGIGRKKDSWIDLEDSVFVLVLVPDGKEQQYIEKLEELPWVESASVDPTFQIPDCNTGPC